MTSTIGFINFTPEFYYSMTTDHVNRIEKGRCEYFLSFRSFLVLRNLQGNLLGRLNCLLAHHSLGMETAS